MPTLASPELLNHVATAGLSEPFPLHQRSPDGPLVSPQSFIDTEIRNERRYGAGAFLTAYNETGFLSGSKYAFRLHPSWIEGKELLWGEEPSARKGIADAIRDFSSTEEHVEIFPEAPAWENWLDKDLKPTRKTFRFPPLGDDRAVMVKHVPQRSMMRINEDDSLDTRFVRTIVKFAHPKKLARNPPPVKFVQIVKSEQDSDGNWTKTTVGNLVQIWRTIPDLEVIGFIMPVSSRWGKGKK